MRIVLGVTHVTVFNEAQLERTYYEKDLRFSSAQFYGNTTFSYIDNWLWSINSSSFFNDDFLSLIPKSF